MNFKAGGTGHVLSFFAVGDLAIPPFLLFDGVTMNAVPDRSSMLVFGVGLLALGAYWVRNCAKRSSAAV